VGAPRKRRTPEPRERAILAAAVEVLARKGYHGCRIADVAREAGVAYGLVYHYFRNKDALLETVFRAGWGEFVGGIRAAAEPDRPLDEGMRALVGVVFDAWLREPRAVRVLILEIARGPGGRINRQKLFEEVVGVLRGLFERAHARGELREGLAPQLAAVLLFGALETALTACVLGSLAPTPEAQAAVVDTFLRGACAAPA
jgi:TetR/AcrR family fatty acid metabolism transcriptional regulator